MYIAEQEWKDLENYRDSLEHYGRKGMKWYEHIFGREQSHAKYSKDQPKKTFRERRADAAKKREAEKKAKEKAKAEKEAAKKEQQRKEILKNPTKLYKHRDEFTYEEIKDAMKRFDWEKQLNSYSRERLQQGADLIDTMVTYANNAIKLYNACARVVNSIGEDTIPFIKEVNNKNKNNKDNKENKDNKDDKDDKNNKK